MDVAVIDIEISVQNKGLTLLSAGNGAGQGGFGAVFGKKGLKAISVIGTGSM